MALNSSSSSFKKASALGWTQAGLVPRVYTLPQAAILPGLYAGCDVIGWLLSQHQVSSSKTVRPHAPCGARCMQQLERGLRFVRRNRISVKRRNPICAWTNEIAQHQSASG